MITKQAKQANILTATIGQGLILTLMGIGIGLLVAVAVTKYLAIFLVGMTARDPLALVLAALGMLAIGIAAAYFPARRASEVDPTKRSSTNKVVLSLTEQIVNARELVLRLSDEIDGKSGITCSIVDRLPKV